MGVGGRGFFSLQPKMSWRGGGGSGWEVRVRRGKENVGALPGKNKGNNQCVFL